MAYQKVAAASLAIPSTAVAVYTVGCDLIFKYHIVKAKSFYWHFLLLLHLQAKI